MGERAENQKARSGQRDAPSPEALEAAFECFDHQATGNDVRAIEAFKRIFALLEGRKGRPER